MNPRRRLLACMTLLVLALSAASVSAQPAPPAPPAAPAQVIEVHVGETVNFALPRAPMIINSEDTSIATLVVQPDGTMRVTGVSVGSTRIVGQDIASVPMIYQVRVVPASARR